MDSLSSESKAPWFRTWGVFAFTTGLLLLALTVPVVVLVVAWAPAEGDDGPPRRSHWFRSCRAAR